MAITLTNTSVDDIYMDIDLTDSYIKKIQKNLSDINASLVQLRKSYQMLADHPKTKGNIKNQALKIIDKCIRYEKSNEALKISLEAQLSKSATEYAAALSAFDELGNLAEDLDYD